MKMIIVLAVCLALSAASASAIHIQWGLYGAVPLTTTMMGAGPCAEYQLRQPQCSPVAEQTMWQPSAICQPPLQQSRCPQAMFGVVPSVVQQLQMMMQLQQGVAGASSMFQPALMQQWQQLLPAAQALTPMAMAVAQVAENMPAMCGLYQLPSYCTTPCATSAAIPPFF